MAFILFTSEYDYEQAIENLVYCEDEIVEEVYQKVDDWFQAGQRYRNFRINLTVRLRSQFDSVFDAVSEKPKKPKGPANMTKEAARAYEPLRDAWNKELDEWQKQYDEACKQREESVSAAVEKALEELRMVGTPDSYEPPTWEDFLKSNFGSRAYLVKYEVRHIGST